MYVARYTALEQHHTRSVDTDFSRGQSLLVRLDITRACFFIVDMTFRPLASLDAMSRTSKLRDS